MSRPAAIFPTATVNPKFGQKLDFIERMTRWSEGLQRADHHRRRLQRRAARMRRLEPQGAAERRQPHAGRGRGADPAAAGARLDRHRPHVRPRARALLHLVELSLARLDQERPRPPARPYVGVARACRPSHGARRARAVPQLGAAVRPCAADLRDRGLSDGHRSAGRSRRLRAGRPVRIDGARPIAIVAVETATPELLDMLDPEPRRRLLISGERAAALALANERDAADPAAAGADRTRGVARSRRRRWRSPIPAATSIAVRSGRCIRSRSTARKRPRPRSRLRARPGLLPALWLVDDRAAAQRRSR